MGLSERRPGDKAIQEDLSLRVAEALSRDVGRGIARLDPQDMARLGVEVGGAVLIIGKRTTVARAMPAHMEDRGQGLLQIDGIIRENAGLGLGEKAQVSPAQAAPAQGVVLAPLGGGSPPLREADSSFLRRLLEGMVVLPGDKLRLTLFGSRHREVSVVEARPQGPVVIGPATTLKLQGERAAAREKTGVTYEDIGGLSREVQRIREMIELPLKYPELFERLGIGPPKGVLLHGPPGCGKTLIARAVANETDALFLPITGPEVIHKFYGESEAHLRAIFEQARSQAPAIIFLDEIDAIASKREEVRGDQQVERRVVAQLLALMDGLHSRGQVIVIGATNIPHVLDPALRRPGRFDREVAISIPDRNGRKDILEIHTRGMPLVPEVDLPRLAEITHGFVGADLEALCREAAMVTLRRIMPQIDLKAATIPYELLLQLEVTMDDFMEAFKEVEPSALREVSTEIPQVSWEDVGGLEEAKQTLQESIEWPLKYPKLLQRAGATPVKGILLTGAPGTGKTLLARAVASQSGVNFISVKGPALLSKWVGESERGVREVFKKARQASPCILFFDEIDSLAPIRGAGGDSQATERVISQFLTELDGIEELKGVVVLAATNRPDRLDPALLRTGRFDRQLELPLPEEKARLQIFHIHTRGKPLAPEVDLEALGRASAGLAGSDIEAVCKEAVMLSLREFLEATGPHPLEDQLSSFQVEARHFQRALSQVQGRRKRVEAAPLPPYYPHQR